MNQSSMEKYILVVEDESDIRDSLCELLESEGFKVQSAANGRKALEYLVSAKVKPQLILLDMLMPEMNGSEFLKEKNKDPDLRNIPVLVMSADIKSEGIKKPLDLDQLFHLLREQGL